MSYQTWRVIACTAVPLRKQRGTTDEEKRKANLPELEKRVKRRQTKGEEEEEEESGEFMFDCLICLIMEE